MLQNDIYLTPNELKHIWYEVPIAVIINEPESQHIISLWPAYFMDAINFCHLFCGAKYMFISGGDLNSQ